MSTKKIIVTGGAGFVGTNLIKLILNKTNYKIISIDNYSSGSLKNHIKNNRIVYLKSDTKKIGTILKNKKKKYQPFFILENFQEFFKVLNNLINVLNLTQMGHLRYLNFV